MKSFENYKENNILNEENKLLNPDHQTKQIITEEMLKYFNEGKVWEAIIVAGEMALSNIDTRKLFSEDQIEKVQNELKQLRTRIKTKDDPNKYIDLARCVYRFQNLSIDFPELDNIEREKLRNIPEYIRTGQNYPKGHLAYLPQIASAIKLDLKTLKKRTDASIVRKEIELDIKRKKGGELELPSMIIDGGLLAEFDSDEARKLLKSEVWGGGKDLQNIFSYMAKIKEEKNGWYLARLLPQVQSLIRLKREK